MPQRLCPTCQHQGRLLPDSSTGARVNYYRCDTCGTVWARDKGDPLAPARIVLRPTSEPRPPPNPAD